MHIVRSVFVVHTCHLMVNIVDVIHVQENSGIPERNKALFMGFFFTYYIVLFSVNNIMLLIKLFRIGPVTCPRLAVLDRGRRPRSNTADRGPVTGPIRNNLINEIFIN